MATLDALLAHDQVVVEQVRRLIDIGSGYGLFSTDGTRIGEVEQVGQSGLHVAARLLSDLDKHLPVELAVEDAAGVALLTLSKPWFRRQVEVARADGSSVGTINKQLRLGKSRFVLTDSAGAEVGAVHAQDWRARRFSIVDATGAEVGGVTKKWGGLVTEMFTDADTYVVDLGSTSGALRTLALAAALSVDVILREEG